MRWVRRLGFALAGLAAAVLVALLALGVGIEPFAPLDGPDYGAQGPPFVASPAGAAAPLGVAHRVLLIGDAGLYLESDATLDALARWSADLPATAVFLGDNLYQRGLQDDDRERGERILSQLLRAGDARKLFVPGNHDWGFAWGDPSTDGLANQQAFFDAHTAEGASHLPRDGCMGPAARIVHEGPPALVVIAIDPTHLLYPRIASPCPRAGDDDGFDAALAALLERHRSDLVVVASHYPLRTGGPHGGFPMGRILDSLRAIVAARVSPIGDTFEPPYRAWNERLRRIFAAHPPLVFAAGHDHSLQVLDDPAVRGALVVSGAGSRDRVSKVTAIDGTRFAHAHPGFVVIDVGTRSGAPAAVLRVVEAGIDEPVYTQELLPGDVPVAR